MAKKNPTSSKKKKPNQSKNHRVDNAGSDGMHDETYVIQKYRDESIKRMKQHSLYNIMTPSIRDRDTILHSSYFRRLGAVTQVVGAFEPYRLNNRQSHSLSVALAGRLLVAQLKSDEKTCDLLKKHNFTDEYVVEAACLAHDLGHPPFGHVGEETLQRLFDKHRARNGFEGNAQSFRILTRLEPTFGTPGMKLTRATLRATLKYPWLRESVGLRGKKWGAYAEDREAFQFAIDNDISDNFERTIEAEIMDWADDAAYAIDDMIDFYTVGMIPLDRLAEVVTEREIFLSGFFERNGIIENSQKVEYEEQLNILCVDFFKENNLVERYSGTLGQQRVLSDVVFHLHEKLRKGTTLSEERPKLIWKEGQESNERFVKLLKGLTWEYVIASTELASLQVGYQQVIEKLFETFLDIAHGSKAGRRILPVRYREMLSLLDDEYGFLVPSDSLIRVAADMVASLTDSEALNFWNRITGQAPGSVFLPPVN